MADIFHPSDDELRADGILRVRAIYERAGSRLVELASGLGADLSEMGGVLASTPFLADDLAAINDRVAYGQALVAYLTYALQRPASDLPALTAQLNAARLEG